MWPIFYYLTFAARVRLAELENPPTISNTLFGGNELQYVLEDFHFHWGRTSADGSEHHIDGNNYPLEVRQKKKIEKLFPTGIVKNV